MADNDQKPGDGQNLLLLNLPNLAVFLFLSWGVLSTKAPLTSLRPEASQGTDTIQSLNVEARFWQDPFFWRMNTNGVEAQAAIPEPNDAFISDSAAVPVQARNSESVLGLVVLLNGDRYPEAIEARIRARYAIVSAMLQGGYAGDKPGDLNLSVIRDAKNNPTSPIFPFAWEEFTAFSPSPYRLYHLDDPHKESPDREEPVKRYSHVDIYYVNESDLERSDLVAANDQPDSFHKLCALVATFTHNMKARFSTNECKMAVLGPSDSLHFVDLVIGAIKDDITHPDPDSDPLPRFDIYSPQPTVSQVVLRKLVADQDDLNYLISAHYIKEDQDAIYLGCRTIFRANGNDDELLKALMGELEARGLNITDPTKRIALITEADSVYGKTIPGRFVQLLRQRSLEKAAQAAYGSDPRKNSTEAGLARQLVEKYGPLKDMQARLAEISQDIQNLKDPYPGLFELQKADLALHSWRSSRELLTLIYRELSDPAAMEMRKSQQNQPPPLNEAETRDEQKFNEAQNLLLADEKNLQDTEAQLAGGTSQVKTDEGDWSKLEDQWRNDRQKTWKDDGHKKDSSNQLEKDIEAINEERRTWESSHSAFGARFALQVFGVAYLRGSIWPVQRFHLRGLGSPGSDEIEMAKAVIRDCLQRVRMVGKPSPSLLYAAPYPSGS